jgi:hypothetical protein
MRRTIASAAAVIHLGVMSVGAVAHALAHGTGSEIASQVAVSPGDTQAIAGHQHCTFCQILTGSSALPDGSVQMSGLDAYARSEVPPSQQVAARELSCLPLGARAPPSA